MKVTSITHGKHEGDGFGVTRVTVGYQANGKFREATLLYDKFTSYARFPSNEELADNLDAVYALSEVVKAYMTLVEYGWEA